jgi:hypothetical protein
MLNNDYMSFLFLAKKVMTTSSESTFIRNMHGNIFHTTQNPNEKSIL